MTSVPATPHLVLVTASVCCGLAKMAWEGTGAWQRIVLLLRMCFPNRPSIVVLATFAALAATTAAIVLFKKKRKLGRLTSKIPAEAAQVTRLNSLYQLYKPTGEPSMEVIFFHGFQRGSYENAHISSWKCRDGSFLWPQTWLVEQFPEAHILSVGYGENVMRSCKGGIIDIHIMTENLISDLLDANIGQAPCRPVIFVGHSFGGLVIKNMCVYASSNIGHLSTTTESSFRLTSLLDNLKGMFFYSTPHLGVSDQIAKHVMGEGPLLEYVKTLNKDKARVHGLFDILCGHRGKYKMWQIAGVGEGRPTLWGKFEVQVVSEASARYRIFNVVEGADHITVCRPIDKKCRSFAALANFLRDVATRSKETVHGLPDRPTALQSRSSELQQKLKSSPVLGIVGMGGIGKTTIAKKLFNDLSPQFEYTCFVDNVKERKLHELNDWILNHFCRGGARLEQNSLQWSHLEMKKALIAMDDVNCEDQVRTLPGLKKFGDGSRLIFTTRDKGVLNYFSHPLIYDVSFLDFDEAKKLFCERAFEEEGIPQKLLACNENLEGNIQKVVEKCNGLPLTLEVMGSYLRCHESNGAVWKGHMTNASVWKETLDTLGNAEPIDGLQKDRVWDTLRVSFDSLAPKEQVLFIEAGISFFKQPVERALSARSATYRDSKMTWANLLRTSMVKEVDGSEYDDWQDVVIRYKEVWVHEHLRDLATSLYKEAIVSKSVGEWYTGPRLRHFISVKERNRNPQLAFELPDQFENLKYLELFGSVQEGLSKNLLEKLSLFKWSGLETKGEFVVSIKHLPINLEDMSNLAVLELEHWKISGERFEALEKLICLRILSLSNIEGPVHLPGNFGHLSSLKTVRLQHLHWLTALPESFGELSNLEDLVVSDCDNLLELPESFGSLASLAKLRIYSCRQLARLPESFRCLSSLRGLTLERCSGLQSLPDNFGQLTALEKLEIVWLEHLKALPVDIGNLRLLKFLSVQYCSGLERLPESFGLLCALQELKLACCSQLQRLPANFDRLQALQRLNVEYCERLQRLPDNFGKLTALEKLKIKRLEKLKALPDDFGNLGSLRFLTLEFCHCLERLPESFGHLSALEELTVQSCRQLQRLPANFHCLATLRKLTLRYSLQRLPDNFGKLTGLEQLTIEGFRQLKALPDDFGNFRSLKFLTLRSCDGLQTWPESFGLLSELQELNLGWCTQVQRLPNNFHLLAALRKLILKRCPRLQSLPDNFGKLTALENLRIEGLQNLKVLPDDFGNLHSLKFLTLESCDCLERLPANFGRLCALEGLTLKCCPQLHRFPDNFGGLAFLRTLTLQDCERVQSLPDNLGELTALEKLTILGFKQLEALPDDFGSLCSLKFLTLESCDCLERLPASFGRLCALEGLTLKCCPQLHRFPDNFGHLASLRTLTLQDCERVQSLPDNLGELTALEKLTILGFKQLEALPDDFGSLCSLKFLTLESCDCLERLPASFGRLCALEGLTLKCCPQLHRFPDNFGGLASLRTLTLQDCERVQNLPDNLGRLTALEKLTIQGFKQLEALPDDFGSLCSLKFLTLESCDCLERFPESFGLLCALETLNVEACPQLQRFPANFDPCCAARSNFETLSATTELAGQLGQTHCSEEV